MNEPALLLVHGFPFDHTLWDPVIALFGPERRVFAPDLRGFGERPLGNEPPSLDVMANDLANFLKEKNIGRAVVAGMSMGGYVTLAFAQHNKEMLAGLALLNSQAAADSAETRAQREAMIARLRRDGPAPVAKAMAEKLFAPDRSRRPEFVRFPIASAEKAGADSLCWAVAAMARRPDRTHILQELKIPILILQGADDQIIPKERRQALAQSAPRARCLELPGVGHCSPLEAAGAVTDALRQLLRDCEPAGQSRA